MKPFLYYPKFLIVAFAAIFSIFSNLSSASGVVTTSTIWTLYSPWVAGQTVTGATAQESCGQAGTLIGAVNPGLAGISGTASGNDCYLQYTGTDPALVGWTYNLIGQNVSTFGCPINSTTSGSSCTCDSGFTPNPADTACIQTCTIPAGTQFDVAGSGSPTTVCYLGCSMSLSGIVTVTLSSGASGYSAVAISSGQQCNGEPAPSSGQAIAAPPPAVTGQPDPCIAAGTCTPVNAPCLATNSCTGTGTGPGGTAGGGGYGNGTGTGNQDLINYLNSATNVSGHGGDLVSILAKQKLLIDATNADSVSQSVTDRNFITSIFYFAPVANSCAPYSGVIHGYPVTINICTYTEMLRSLLTWLLGLFTAWIVFTTIFRAKI